MSQERLAAQGIRKEYNGRIVVSNVSVDVAPGEVVGLLGPNGAGKTTSFYMIVGLVRPDAGHILIGDRDITALPVYARARAGIGYLPQEPSVFRNLTVRENLELVCQETGLSKKTGKGTADALMEQFGITHISDTKGYALSGGERRRVEIARALTLKPQFILLDEPFSGIDPIAVNDIQSTIHALKAQGYMGAHHGSQRPRDALHHGPHLSHPRRHDLPERFPGRGREQSPRAEVLSGRQLRVVKSGRIRRGPRLSRPGPRLLAADQE